MAKKQPPSRRTEAVPTALFERIRAILEQARAQVARSVNTEMVRAYWLVGREIVEEEQRGKERAGYGEELIAQLSARLRAVFDRGFTPVESALHAAVLPRLPGPARPGDSSRGA